jgi:hypothetical protein
MPPMKRSLMGMCTVLAGIIIEHPRNQMQAILDC